MDIAILFVGELRWIELSNSVLMSNFTDSLKDQNIKFFTHLWRCKKDHNEIFTKFINQYPQTAFEIENQKSPEYIQGFFENQKLLKGSFASQSFSFYKAFLLLKEYQIQNNTKFDLYIKLRTDLAFLNPINFENLDTHSIYSKNMYETRDISVFANDYLFMTKNFDNVEKLAKIGFYFDEITKNPSEYVYGGGLPSDIFCPEEVLAKYIKYQNIESKTHSFDIDLARHHQ